MPPKQKKELPIVVKKKELIDESESEESSSDELDNKIDDINESDVESEVETEKNEDEEDEEDDDENEDDEVESETKSIVKDDDKEEDDEDCIYSKHKGVMEEYEDDNIDNISDDGTIKENQYVDEKDKITTNKLTKYERVNIIGTRAAQIARGAQTMIKNTSNMTAIEIAKLELEMKVCPILIKRKLSSGEIELWDVNKLTICN